MPRHNSKPLKPSEETFLMGDTSVAPAAALSSGQDPVAPEHDVVPSSPPTSPPDNQAVHNSLQDAKDRAQITATSSMSIVHTVLLKTLLFDYAPTSSTRIQYFICLSLVVTALVTQVIAGFIALYIAFIRKYLRKYKTDAGDFRSTICPWSCRKRKEPPRFDIEQVFAAGDAEVDDQDGGCCSCLPCECYNKLYVYNGHDIFDYHRYLQTELIKIDVSTANYKQQIEIATADIARLKKALNDNGSDDKNEKPNGANSDDDDALQQELQQALEKLRDIERNHNNIEMHRSKCLAMQKHTDAIQNEIILKQAETWQNLLNILLYIVFILNIFLVGFGELVKAGSGDDSAQVAGNNVTKIHK